MQDLPNGGGGGGGADASINPRALETLATPLLLNLKFNRNWEVT